MDYAACRERIYQPLKASGTFIWDWMYGSEYALASLYKITSAQRRELAAATNALGKIFAKCVSVLSKAEDELLLELGLPATALPAVRISA